MSMNMELERELIRKKLLDPDLLKLIEKTSGFDNHKSAEISEKARQSGNLLYVQKKHTPEIHETNLNCFSMSIAFAPAASELLALGYGNRSALLLHLKKFQASIEDIDRALSITKSRSLKIKLLCRKVECLIALNSPESSTVFEKAVEYFNKIDEKDTENKSCLYNVINRTKTVLDLKKKIVEYNLKKGAAIQNGKEQSSVFNSVHIKNSNKYGRHLIATRHIKPGEIFYEEKPFVVCPNGVKLYVNCNHCLAIAWNGVPCKHCNWCIFCSSKCRKEAWIQYHHVECSVITHMTELNRNYSQNFQMSLRAVIKGLRECGGIDKLKAEIELMNSCKDYHKHLLSDKKPEKFCSILNLSSYIQDKHFDINIFNSAIALSYAAKYTTLFGKNLLESETCNSLADNEEVLFIGCLLLKFVQICNKHAYSFSTSMRICKHADETVRCLKKYCKDKLSYLAPVSGLINNSCIPNAKRCFTWDQKIIFYALESIAKNAQIFESYICSFYETPKTIDRRAIISKNFNFDCDCAACLKDWPSLLTSLKEEEVTSISPLTDLRANFLEGQLAEEYREPVKQAAGVDTKCDEKTILELRKGIERACALLAQPSNIRCTLLFSMRRVFDKMYGNDPDIFSCQCPNLAA